MTDGRWYVAGGEEQDSGFRSQESEVRSENEGHLLSAFCFLPSAFCLLPAACCIWGAAARAKNPPPWSLSPGNLFGLICFVSKCRLSGRLKEESLSSRWG